MKAQSHISRGADVTGIRPLFEVCQYEFLVKICKVILSFESQI